MPLEKVPPPAFESEGRLTELWTLSSDAGYRLLLTAPQVGGVRTPGSEPWDGPGSGASDVGVWQVTEGSMRLPDA